MVFNQINNQFGLFQFLKRYGQAIQELIKEINGFTTKTSGVYNPIYSKPKWKNTKSKPYTEEDFDVSFSIPLTVHSVKDGSFKLPLHVCTDTIQNQKDSISVVSEFDAERITTMSVIKSTIPHKLTNNLKIMALNRGENVNTLNINKSFNVKDNTPIQMQTWLRKSLITKLGVYSNLTSKVTDRISDGSVYIIRDVGTISEIELLDIIGTIEEVEMINAI